MEQNVFMSPFSSKEIYTYFIEHAVVVCSNHIRWLTCYHSLLQFEYAEGEITLRFLRLKHSNVRQNITYDCKGGMDGFMLVKLLGANGETLTFHDKTVRLVSQVRKIYHKSEN